MNNVEQLIKQVHQCHLCASQLPYPPKPILQIGANAKILIAGQAPGDITHHKGIPFDDASGERLRSWLGVDKTQFYDPNLFAILPMGFCYPGKNKGGDKPPLPICAVTWRQLLLAQLTQLQLTIIIGKYAIAWHLQQTLSVTDAVANNPQYWPQQIVLPHPSPRNNIWLKQHPEFAEHTLTHLKQRVQQILTN